MNMPKQIFCMHLAVTKRPKLLVIGRTNIKAPVSIMVPDKKAILRPFVVQNLLNTNPEST